MPFTGRVRHGSARCSTSGFRVVSSNGPAGAGEALAAGDQARVAAAPVAAPNSARRPRVGLIMTTPSVES